MWITYNIAFQSDMPSINKVLETFRNNTGLQDIQLRQIEGTAHEILHPLFAEHKLFLYSEENRFCVNTGSIGSWYLKMAAIANLVNLGGKTEAEIPEWAFKKWNEVKNLLT